MTEARKKILRLFLSAGGTAVDTLTAPDLKLWGADMEAFQEVENEGLVRRIDAELWALTLQGITEAAKLMKPWQRTIFVTKSFRYGEVVDGLDPFTLEILDTMLRAVPDATPKFSLIKLSDGTVGLTIRPVFPIPSADPAGSATKAPCDAQAVLKLREAELQREMLDRKIEDLRERVLRRGNGE